MLQRPVFISEELEACTVALGIFSIFSGTSSSLDPDQTIRKSLCPDDLQH
jgi:hypothetical protein